MVDRIKVATFMGTDRPHVLRQAIHCCRNFGTVSIVGVYGGFLDKIPMGSAINRGLTFRMAQTPVQHYLPKLLELIEKGEIDPSFVITHRRAARRRARSSTRRSATRRTAASRLSSSPMTEAQSDSRSLPMLDTARKLAVVTGASTGIGLELARQCAKDGSIC